MRREIITNLYVKEKRTENDILSDRKHHLRDWPGDTMRIEEEEYDCIGSLKIPNTSDTTEALYCLSLTLQTQYAQKANKDWQYRNLEIQAQKRYLKFKLESMSIFCYQLPHINSITMSGLKFYS